MITILFSNVVTNSFALTFKVGGTSAPALELAMGTAHVDIPTHSIEDVISLETNSPLREWPRPSVEISSAFLNCASISSAS